MQQVELDPVRPQPPEGPCALDHLLRRLAGQTVDEVNGHADAPRLQGRIAREEVGVSVAAVDLRRRVVKSGLQAELDGELGFFVQLAQKVQHLRRQAVRAGRDREAADALVRERRFKKRPQNGRGRVGVRVRLKVGNGPGPRRLCADARKLVVELLCDRDGGALREVAAAAAAVDAAAEALGTVEVRAAHARVERGLEALLAPAGVFVCERMVALVVVGKGKIHAAPHCFKLTTL